MNDILYPWLAEIVLITYRTGKSRKQPPLPSEYLATFVIFGALSLLPESGKNFGRVFGWGIVLATLLNIPAAQKLYVLNSQTQAGQSSAGGGGGLAHPAL